MNDAQISAAIALYAAELAIPVTDAVSRAPAALVAMVLRAFPELGASTNGQL
jgi:hypothetical protein